MKKSSKIFLVIFIVTVAINGLAWVFTPFCDWYRKYIFKFILGTYGRFTGIFPFSVGEVMIVIGVCMLVLFIVAVICGLIFRKIERLKKYLKHLFLYYKIFAGTLLFIFVIMTFNCFILYHCTTFGDEYLRDEVDYDKEALINLRNELVVRCNELSAQMERDEAGNIIYEGDVYAESVACMKALGERFPSLAGFYPNPKNIHFSGFLSQQGVLGIFYPFSMEANVNSMMYIANYPATICHELAHIKGYIFEDDANFIGYLAAASSADPFFKYSAYLSVLFYVDDDFFAVVSAEDYGDSPEIDDLVYYDSAFLTPEAWEKVEENAVIDTDVVWHISSVATDTSLKANGVKEGSISYSKVVELLLRYGENFEY